jgi:hypothetical protein
MLRSQPRCSRTARSRSTTRSVAWCSTSVWSAPDGSNLLTLGASSVQTAPEGSCRIVWMIKRMIKPCDAAPSATRPRRPLWGRHQIFHLVTAGGLACGTAAVPSSAQRITRQPRIVHGGLVGALFAPMSSGSSSQSSAGCSGVWAAAAAPQALVAGKLRAASLARQSPHGQARRPQAEVARPGALLRLRIS